MTASLKMVLYHVLFGKTTEAPQNASVLPWNTLFLKS
jgi:hypothetical protein